MTRTFTSARAALSYACAVRGHAAGPAQLGRAHGGPPPNQALASDIWACLARVGLDPHQPTPLLEAVQGWATDGGPELDQQMSAKLDSVLSRVSRELAGAGLVDARRERLQQLSSRAVEVDGVVRYHASTGPGPTRQALRKRIEAGIEAPERDIEPAVTEPGRAELLDACAKAYADGDITAAEIDAELEVQLDIGNPAARRLRRQMGITSRPGRKKRTGHKPSDTTNAKHDDCA